MALLFNFLQRKMSTSAASSVAANDDDHRETKNPLSTTQKKYSGLKIKKIPKKDTNRDNDKGDFTLNSAPPLTADEINVRRPKRAEVPSTEDIDLSNR